MSVSPALWINGPARSGKTAQLIELFNDWTTVGKATSTAIAGRQAAARQADSQGPALLLFAATGDNRLALVDRLTEATGGQYPIRSTTPLAFFEAEVTLFWPLLVERLGLNPQFPLRLRPETEQALARSLWQPLLEDGSPLAQEGVSPERMVRRILDIHLLAASGNVPAESIGLRLQGGMASALGSEPLWQAMGEALLQWRRWCLQRGLLTYGILTELYGQQLLADPSYQQQLLRRYDGFLADDVDEYPAIAASLFSFVLDQNCPIALTYNPNGATRLGFGADPDALKELAPRCERIELEPASDSLEPRFGDRVLRLIDSGGLSGESGPSQLNRPPAEVSGGGSGDLDLADFWEGPFHAIQGISRAQLLRAIANEIIRGVHSGQVAPAEIAILGPGVDPIARYTLMEILRKQNIRLEPLLEQRPLSSAPMVRALLTLLAFIYPGLGQLVTVDQVAEMLVVLSLSTVPVALLEDTAAGDAATRNATASNKTMSTKPAIDAVRAGLLADHCYRPDPQCPQLLPVEQFARWDRLGYQATAAYQTLCQWIENQRLQQQQRLTLSPVVVLDRAIQTFLWNGSLLSYDQLAALRELMEAAQHFWQVEQRLGQVQGIQTPVSPERASPLAAELERTPADPEQPEGRSQPQPASPAETQPYSSTSAVARFIQLLRSGAISANPYPAKPLESQPDAVTLATIFQYRISRPQHRWLFWLDASSSLWITTGTGLFGAGVFLSSAPPRQTSADALRLAEARLEQSLRNLLGRATERIYLGASELSTAGQPQMGPMLPLVEIAAAMQPEPLLEPSPPELPEERSV